MFFGWKKWELALMAGVLVGLLTAPVQAQELPLSRWTALEQTQKMEYRICLFPFAVGEESQPAMAVEPEEESLHLEVRFYLIDWWEKIRHARDL